MDLVIVDRPIRRYSRLSDTAAHAVPRERARLVPSPPHLTPATSVLSGLVRLGQLDGEEPVLLFRCIAHQAGLPWRRRASAPGAPDAGRTELHRQLDTYLAQL
jgi:hypothetical protein